MTTALNSFQSNLQIFDVTLLSGDQKIWPNVEGLPPSLEVSDAFLVTLVEGNLNNIEGGEIPLQIPPASTAPIPSKSVPVALTPVGAESVSHVSKPDNLSRPVDINYQDLHSTRNTPHQPTPAMLPVGQITYSDPSLPINSAPLPTTENTTRDPVGLPGRVTRPTLRQQVSASETETLRTPPNQARHQDLILTNGTATPLNAVALYEEIETASVLSSTKLSDSKPTQTILKVPVQGARHEPIGAPSSNFSGPHRSSIRPSQPIPSRQELSSSDAEHSITIRPQPTEHIATKRQVPVTKFGTCEESCISNELTTFLKGHAPHTDFKAPEAAPNNAVPPTAELPKNCSSFAASNFSRDGHLNPNSVPSDRASEVLGGAREQSSIEPGALVRTPSPAVPIAQVSTNLSSPSPPAVPPQLPGHISAQICSAMSANQGQEIEISLNPEELGRVRIVLSTKEGGMNVMVFSDKPDVLDLMRRHSDQLEMDFTDIGYQGASFTFQQEQEGNQSPPELPGIETPRDIAPSQQEYETVDDGRLDLRL